MCSFERNFRALRQAERVQLGVMKKMALVKTAEKTTNYVLPVAIKVKDKVIKRNRYYDNEYMLFKAYYQLKAINGVIKPLYPIIYE